jgi:hypothetical protein
MLITISLAERRAILTTIIVASTELGDAAMKTLRDQPNGMSVLDQIDSSPLPPEDADPALTNGWRMMRAATQLVKTIDTLAPLFGMSVAEAFEPLLD